jgi:uncharacterized protein (UPF0147 family)
MRNRLGGGIVDFYRMQATGELVPGQTLKPAERGSKNGRGPQAQRSPERAAFARAGVEVPSPAIKDSALARNVMAAVEQGSHIQCNAKQYPAIRAALTSVAENPGDSSVPAYLVRDELERLDQFFRWKQ